MRELELRLLEPSVRASRQALEQLLAPGFVEYGASGRRFDRAQILEELGNEAPCAYAAEAFEFLALAPALVQVRYVSSLRRGDTLRRARRSSLWLRSDAGWRMMFHQGTPIPDAA